MPIPELSQELRPMVNRQRHAAELPDDRHTGWGEFIRVGEPNVVHIAQTQAVEEHPIEADKEENAFADPPLHHLAEARDEIAQ